MQSLSLAHQFFHISAEQWEQWKNKKQLSLLFQQNIFHKRLLKIDSPSSLYEAEKLFYSIEKKFHNIYRIPYDSAQYPAAIKKYLPKSKCPAILYARGSLPKEEHELVAMVGTRKPSTFGIENAHNFASFYTAHGISLLSGLARGIDTICHQRNIEKQTFAVLGGCVCQPYPQENNKLAEEILTHGGGLLSPFPPLQVPLPHNFPYRNELIAALSIGTITIEGAPQSGAIVTAKVALEMGKNVVALTQDFRSAYGRGAIHLVQMGALPVSKEEESLSAIFASIGGFSSKIIPPKSRKAFNFYNFHQATQKSLPEALALLQEGLNTGKIIRIAPDRYHLK